MKSKKTKSPLCGFIGQGWIGKHYADDFEARGFSVVRYAKEPAFEKNSELIKECDIVFIAVPTPSTPKGFDDNIVREVVKLVGKGKVAIIKSTIVPGTTASIQKENPDIFVFHSPEFLMEMTAAYDASHPNRNIIGIPVESDEARLRAKEVIDVLPKAPFELICRALEAELIKYGGNCLLYFKVMYVNMLYDLAQKEGIDYAIVRDAMAADPRLGSTHLDPIHKSGRGAGGHCFIKDFAAFREMYENEVGDKLGVAALRALEEKNIDLLKSSGKDLELLRGVYGEI
jgi:nucleotide sugar dehydrogenase